MISLTILYILFVVCFLVFLYFLYIHCICGANGAYETYKDNKNAKNAKNAQNAQNAKNIQDITDPHVRVPKADKIIRKLCKESGFNAIFVKKNTKNERSEWSFEDNDTSVNQGHLRYREIDPNGRVVKELVQDLYVKSFALDKRTKTYKGKMRRFFQDPSNSDPEEVHFEYNRGNGKLKLKFSPTFILRGQKVPPLIEMQKM